MDRACSAAVVWSDVAIGGGGCLAVYAPRTRILSLISCGFERRGYPSPGADHGYTAHVSPQSFGVWRGYRHWAGWRCAHASCLSSPPSLGGGVIPCAGRRVAGARAFGWGCLGCGGDINVGAAETSALAGAAAEAQIWRGSLVLHGAPTRGCERVFG
ncbi:hypothetical protein C8R44DRAFT_877784 [Mycena epipterygia]|nr:hypothetical protein C8R44DRAFT_877784 [Mycena epipterygia]